VALANLKSTPLSTSVLFEIVNNELAGAPSAPNRPMA
jgi:hypothetical protein